jgi:hypothetical protein
MSYLKKIFKRIFIFFGVFFVAIFTLFVLFFLELNKILGDIVSFFRKNKKRN